MAKSQKMQGLLASLTLEEKAALLGGKNMWETSSIPRLGISSVKTTDGPAGVRGAIWTQGTHSTYIPCGISLAATFDRDLVERIGRILGEETRSKNAHVLLAPTMNMSRSPLGGRNFENFGEDPFLTGTIATSIVSGIQSQGVGACPKHYVGNEQESRRFNIDEYIDERTLREVYLRPFQMVSRAKPWMFMTSYNKVNGEHPDMSKRLIQDILRDEWGFDGVVLSDWGGLNDTVLSVLAGTDLEMPGPPIRRGQKLVDAVNEGRLSETDLDSCVERMLKLVDKAIGIQVGGQRNPEGKDEGSADRPEVRQTAKDAAVGGIVLLKNEGILPLQPKELKSLAILGPNALTPTVGGSGSASVNPYYISTPYESISALAKIENPSIEITHERGILTHKMIPLPGPIIRNPGTGEVGLRMDFYAGHNWEGPVVASTNWSTTQIFLMSDGDVPEVLQGKAYSFRAVGTVIAPVTGAYTAGISSTGKAKLFVDNELVIDNSNWVELGEGFMNCGSKEQRATLNFVKGQSYQIRIDQIAVPPPVPPHDNTLFHTLSGLRFGLMAPIDEEALFNAATDAAKEADAVVLVIGHNNATEREGSDRTSLALPGRTADLVRAVAQVNSRLIVINQSACAVDLYSWSNTPQAIIQAWYQGQETGNAIADVLFGKANPGGKLPITFPIQLDDHGSNSWFPGDVANDRAEYGEKTLIGHRWFDQKKIQPAWEFGYGGSYTTFELSEVKVEDYISTCGISTAKVRLFVTNTGERLGSEVVQVYASQSAEISARGLETAPRVLVGFAKVHLDPREKKQVIVELDSSAVEWYDAELKKWRVDAGTYQLAVGTSSRDIEAIVAVEVQ